MIEACLVAAMLMIGNVSSLDCEATSRETYQERRFASKTFYGADIRQFGIRASIARDQDYGEVGLEDNFAPNSPGYRDPVWDALAECESGNWIDDGTSFETGSARWDWAKPGTEVPPWGTRIHHGGLQFRPSTWSWVAPMVGLGHIQYAYDATREEQIRVAEKVLELQGWNAWPVCSRKLGLQ